MQKAKILKINNKNIQFAARQLKKGKIIIYPTESSYAIGCIALNKKAVRRIYKIKKRKKPLPMIVPNIKTIEKYGKLSKSDKKLIKKFMPGPLTLVVLKKSRKIPDITNKQFVFRIPGNKHARLLTKFAGPLVSTSANISGRKPIYKIKKIIKTFEKKVDLILDSGDLHKRKPSTIIKNRKIIRKGAISGRKIKKVI